MRANTPGSGFSVPEGRLSPYPFYWRLQSPEVFRWEWLNWPPDAVQRKFYEVFTGRTQGSIWASECAAQTESGRIYDGRYEDPLSWGLPHVDIDTGYLAEPAPYDGFLQMHLNYRPTNPTTGRVAVATEVDELYIAPRVTLDRGTMRAAMNLPDPAGVSASAEYWWGLEVNSQGGSSIAALVLAGNAYSLYYKDMAHHSPEFGYGGVSSADIVGITINNPDDWCNYYLTYDPPVVRFVQPTAGQTLASTNPDMLEISVAGLPRGCAMQPFVANESTVNTSAAANQWLFGQWAIRPLVEVQGNTYRVATQTDPQAALVLVFDTGGRPWVDVYVESIAAEQNVNIYGSSVGADNVATRPEVRTWVPVRYASTSENLIGGLYVYYGLIQNGYRWVRVVLGENEGTGTQVIRVSANG